jgi:hypothetical protein
LCEKGDEITRFDGTIEACDPFSFSIETRKVFMKL